MDRDLTGETVLVTDLDQVGIVLGLSTGRRFWRVRLTSRYGDVGRVVCRLRSQLVLA